MDQYVGIILTVLSADYAFYLGDNDHIDRFDVFSRWHYIGARLWEAHPPRKIWGAGERNMSETPPRDLILANFAMERFIS